MKSTTFNVYAFTSNGNGTDGTVFMGTNDEGHGHSGVNISYQDGKWNYTSPAELKYWPTSALNFYAVNPKLEIPTYSWQISQTKKEISVSTQNEYEDPSHPKNIDIMYAISKNQTKSLNGGTVHMQFRHILSQVAFKARTETSNMEVKIEGIKICNCDISGKFTLPSKDVAPTREDNWTPTSILSNITAVKGKLVDVGITETSISMDEPMLFIPQKLNKWTTTAASPKPITQTKAAKESYLEISCKIKLNGSDIIGNESEFGQLYVPFGADWQPGKRYIYTLVFGGGYDKDGKSILTPINFTADTETWLDESSNLVTE